MATLSRTRATSPPSCKRALAKAGIYDDEEDDVTEDDERAS